jgi:membrane fusion protein, copper/silver efflux system
MKKNKVSTVILVIAVFIVAAGILLNGHYHFLGSSTPAKTTKDLYYCPMHPNFTSDKPGECNICGMSLVKREAAGQTGAKPSQGAAKKILFYRNPMDPTVTSPVPMKDSMGMDYTPVYEEQASRTQSGIYINPEKQQLIGVKKQKVEVRNLTGKILTVGKVAYDPELYVAQDEYLQSVKTNKNMAENTAEQPESFTKTARKKLLLLGMSSKEIDDLTMRGKADLRLYLPDANDSQVWVYLTIYEYESALVKEGLPIEIETIAYPGEIFKGSIISIAPVLNTATRTLNVRALVNNTSNKLKLGMYVNAAITYNLGNKLAVPQDAVMDSGTRKIVFIADANGYFKPKEVTLGSKSEGYYEILQGLSEGQEVVTSGNFLVDSESKLNAVLSQMSDSNNK